LVALAAGPAGPALSRQLLKGFAMTARRFVAGILPALFLVTGCGDSSGLNRGGEVSGPVTIDGQPLGGGRVEFYSEDGKNSVFGEIRPDGTYAIAEPPLGPCKVVVVTSYLANMTPPPPGAGSGMPGMVLPKDVGLVFTAIPTKYEDVKTSDLRATLTKGKQTHAIKLSR
jgi:hypothetical protein